MNEYADAVWKKANAKVRILAKIRRFISENTAAKINKTMIRPHLDYIDFGTDSSSADRVCKLDTLQNKALRWCQESGGLRDCAPLTFPPLVPPVTRGDYTTGPRAHRTTDNSRHSSTCRPGAQTYIVPRPPQPLLKFLL